MRRLGTDVSRWRELSERDRTGDEEHEWCVLQWATDYSPTVDGRAFAEADWAARDTGVTINHACNRALSEANIAMADQVLTRLPHSRPRCSYYTDQTTRAPSLRPTPWWPPPATRCRRSSLAQVTHPGLRSQLTRGT